VKRKSDQVQCQIGALFDEGELKGFEGEVISFKKSSFIVHFNDNDKKEVKKK